jgi:phytoene synthase
MLESALESCQAIIRKNSKSFSLASRFLPSAQRAATVAIYAWCRRVDDAIDDVPKARAAEALVELEAELDAIEAGNPGGDPILGAFFVVMRGYRIPFVYPRELLRGMQMDVEHRPFDTLDLTLHYSYRVASTVGLMLCHVFGVTDNVARHHAAHLGMAMQLSNICRDVAEDEARNRVYLPRELAKNLGERHGVLAMLGVADDYYRSADRGLLYLPWRVSLAVRTARLVYAEIGEVLRRRGGDTRQGRAVVSTTRKLWLLSCAGLAWLGELRPRFMRAFTKRREECLLELSYDELSRPHLLGGK